MSRLAKPSFQTRLFAAFLVVSLVPLLLCSSVLMQIFRLRMTGDAHLDMAEDLERVSQSLDTAFDSFFQAVQRLQSNPILTMALTGGAEGGTRVYGELFSATGQARDYARFDLYDSGGHWRYSTQQSPARTVLPTDWGVLYAAASGEGLCFAAGREDGAPVLQGAAVLRDRLGRTAGYLVLQVDASGFRRLTEGKYGTQNDLMILSRYWRPVYCPGQTAALAPLLRERLLAGLDLDGLSEDFSFAAAQHEASGLYLVLQRPRVFTQDITRLSYTVSLGCAAVGVAVSVLMSLKLSRQMSRPIQRLRRGFGQVEQDDLTAYVPPDRDDELGELVRRFNNMVAALRSNREQLVENQRELTQTQIRMLQAQLNPHFLCNTLDTMKWISKINKVPQVALMSTNLADILRFCISPEEFVPLGREVEILRRYIEIQTIRLSDRFRFSVRVPLELEDCMVPKMVLQPIVENAILHGLDGVEDGRIALEAREEAGVLAVTVTDNGRGLPPGMEGPCRNLPREAGHLGLYNVDTILLKYYGEGFGLYLGGGKEGGAAVTATLPVRREEEAEC